METRELTKAPGLLPLYGRAVLPRRRRGGELPRRRLVLPDAAPDRDRLRRYAAVCGFPGESADGALPATYPHVTAFPLSMALMAARDFPYPMLGLVHLANRIEQLRPLDPRERLTYVVDTGGARPHPKGTTFTVTAAARRGGATVWRETSTYLSRGAGSGTGTGTGAGTGAGADSGAGSGTAAESEPEPPDLTGARVRESWNLPGSLGRAYAAASGDRNPIHLHPLAARLFGFRRAIAHGMWSKARCLAALADRLPEAYAVEVAFRSPVLLPTAVRFRAEPAGDGGWAFELHGADGRREHLRGSVSALG